MRLGSQRKSLRVKIIAWSLIPTAIILLAVALFNYFAYQQVTEELVFTRDADLTRYSASQLSLQLSQETETDLVVWVRAWDIYQHNPLFQDVLFNRVRNIIDLRIGESGTAYLVDGQGRVIYHPDSRFIGRDFSSQPAVALVLEGQSGTIRTFDPDGQEIVASFAPVPDTTWGLINQESWAELSQVGRKQQQFLLGLLILGLLAPVLVIAIGVRRITRPIARLVVAAGDVAQGNFEQRIDVSTGDELEALAAQFNRMAGALQESYTSLEQRVTDRTRVLEALNAIITSVNEPLALQTTLQRVLERIQEVLGMEVGAIWLLEESEEGGAARLRCQVNDSNGPPPPWEEVETLAEPLLESGEAWIAEDIWVGPHGPEFKRLGLRALAVLPIEAKDHVLGLLALATRQTPHRFDVEERRLLQAVSAQVGVAAENARLYEDARQRAVVEERTRLARELHDSVTQALYGVTLYAEAAARLLSSGEVEVATEYLRELRGTALESLRELRSLIFELRPSVLQREGLAPAIQSRLEAVEGRGGLETQFDVEGEESLPLEVAEGLYRIAQEALNNVCKHARAHHVTVYLKQGAEQAVLEVTDDGVGFDPATARDHGGLGLCGMEERSVQLGGALTLSSAPGEGTRVRVEVSLSVG